MRDKEQSNRHRYEGQDCLDRETRVNTLYFVTDGFEAMAAIDRLTVPVLPKLPCDCQRESIEELIP